MGAKVNVEQAFADGGFMEMMRDWGGKLVGATLRIAGILHCIEFGPDHTINLNTINAAIRIADYLIPHAKSALALMEAFDSRVHDDAMYVLRWIEELRLQRFTKRDAHRHGQYRFKKAADLDPALEELVKRGYVRKLSADSSGPGRKPSSTYEVNPRLYETKPASCVDIIDRMQQEDWTEDDIVNTITGPDGTILRTRESEGPHEEF